MATTIPEIPSGFLGNLSSSQEENLREFWKLLLQSWDTNDTKADGATKSPTASGGPAKSHRRFFSLSRSQPPIEEEDTSAIPSKMLASLKDLGAGPPEIKRVQSLLTELNGEDLRTAYLSMLKQDHPDALHLRFLRAEKWNVPKAWIKFVGAVNWRVNEFHVDEEVLQKGEAYALDKAQNGEGAEKEDAEGFVVQLNTGKGHLHGADKFGRPMIVVRVRTHNPSEQSDKALNNYIIHCIETVRIVLTPPVETMTIVFDLTSFTLSNWDFPPIKFIVENFQEHYPESLGAIIFYNAPWIFSGLWKLIHGIMDPVVAAKVHFLSGAKGLEQMVPQDRIIKELGGDEDWEYQYIQPQPHENNKLNDVETRNRILADRKRLGDELFSISAAMVADSEAETSKSRRDEVIEKLRDNYWTLDPYVRARGLLDRTGVIKGNGEIDFYPGAGVEEESQPEEVTIQASEMSKEKVEHLEHKTLEAVAA